MEWFYVDGGQRAGPVAETEFDRLIATGKIQAETLVWRDGMANWQPLREIRPIAPPATGYAPPFSAQSPATIATAPAANEVVCAHCQGIFPRENTIQYGTSYVCAACKPAFIQKLKEGATTEVGMNYAGFWIRFGAKLIDGLVMAVISIPVLIFMFASMFSSNPGGQPGALQLGLQAAVQFGISILSVLYVTFFHGRYGATLGKMACGLKVVTPEGGSISYARAFGRACAEILSGVICYIGYIIAAFDGQKRSLHDHIASTRVIRVR
jgi:uncharacterized RDD family membrane protein YckC